MIEIPTEFGVMTVSPSSTTIGYFSIGIKDNSYNNFHIDSSGHCTYSKNKFKIEFFDFYGPFVDNSFPIEKLEKVLNSLPKKQLDKILNDNLKEVKSWYSYRIKSAKKDIEVLKRDIAHYETVTRNLKVAE